MRTDGAVETHEVQDLIGAGNQIETRVFGPITAAANGAIQGEIWGGSTNTPYLGAQWRAWTIVRERVPHQS